MRADIVPPHEPVQQELERRYVGVEGMRFGLYDAAPLRTPPLEGSTTRKAVSGSGSSATARPIRIRSKITAFPRLTKASGRPARHRAGLGPVKNRTYRVPP